MRRSVNQTEFYDKSEICVHVMSLYVILAYPHFWTKLRYHNVYDALKTSYLHCLCKTW